MGITLFLCLSSNTPLSACWVLIKYLISEVNRSVLCVDFLIFSFDNFSVYVCTLTPTHFLLIISVQANAVFNVPISQLYDIMHDTKYRGVWDEVGTFVIEYVNLFLYVYTLSVRVETDFFFSSSFFFFSSSSFSSFSSSSFFFFFSYD